MDSSKFLEENKYFDAILMTSVGEISFNYFREKVIKILKIPDQMTLIELMNLLIGGKTGNNYKVYHRHYATTSFWDIPFEEKVSGI